MKTHEKPHFFGHLRLISEPPPSPSKTSSLGLHEVSRDGPGDAEAVGRAGAPAQLVDDHQRPLGGHLEDAGRLAGATVGDMEVYM